MTPPDDVKSDQAALWNGEAGRAWVEAQPLLDRMYRPFEDLLVAAVAARSPRGLLDVGCGAGATTIAASRQLARGGRAVGVDISEPLIAAATARAAREGVPAEFIRADAGVHTFQPGEFEMIISRFGVMFFDDPVRAFTHLRSAATDDAALHFVAWRGPADNAFMTTAERAAAPLLPQLPPRRADAPGQFGFADPERVRRILDASGWSGIDIRSLDVECTLPEARLPDYLTRFGPLGRVLDQCDPQTRVGIVATVREAFDPFVHGDEVRFTAACWQVTAGGRRL